MFNEQNSDPLFLAQKLDLTSLFVNEDEQTGRKKISSSNKWGEKSKE